MRPMRTPLPAPLPDDELRRIVVTSVPRLKLGPRPLRDGSHGAWWPRTWDFTEEFPTLVAVLSVRLRVIVEIVVPTDGWLDVPVTISVFGSPVFARVDALMDPGVVELRTIDGTILRLRVLSPDLDHAVAHESLMSVFDLRNSKRPNGMPDLERWATDGGGGSL